MDNSKKKYKVSVELFDSSEFEPEETVGPIFRDVEVEAENDEEAKEAATTQVKKELKPHESFTAVRKAEVIK
jgi:hypothetical protein